MSTMDSVMAFLQSLQGLPAYGLLFGALAASGFGLPINEDILLLVAAALTLRGVMEPVPLIAVAWCGLLTADALVFHWGHRFGAPLLRHRAARRVLPAARLVDVYAEQRFKGGYLARRRRLYGPNVYFPFLLTLPGSVFLIETEDGKGLADLCRYGLPLPALTKTVAEPGWRNCPYVPENGYGRIVADHLSADAGGALTKVDHV